MRRSAIGRKHHGGERGLTLLELAVTLFVMALALVAVLKAFSVTQLTTGATTTDASLASVARQAGDYIESENLPYIACTGPAGQAPAGVAQSYQNLVQTAVGTSVTIAAVNQAVGSLSSDTVNGVPNQPLQPVNGCSSGPATGPDFGVQQIKYTVTLRHRSLTRTVYKRWN